MPWKQGVGMRRCACVPSSTPCRRHRRTLRRTTAHPSLSPCPPPSPVINKLRGTTTSVVVIPLPLLPCLYPLPLPPSPATLPLLPFFWFYQRWRGTGGRHRGCGHHGCGCGHHWPVMTWQSGCWQWWFMNHWTGGIQRIWGRKASCSSDDTWMVTAPNYLELDWPQPKCGNWGNSLELV